MSKKLEHREMDKGSLVRLREQLDAAIESDTPENCATLARCLADALKKMNGAPAAQASGIDDMCAGETEAVLQAIEEVWLRGSMPPSLLPVSPAHQARLAGLLSDMLAVQNFALGISKGDLSQSLKVKGVMAGSFKAVQSSLRHLTWQTHMIAKGDFSQRVDFMGEFSESFNSMVRSLSEAHDQIKSYTEKLLRANADLKAEIAEREQAEEEKRLAQEDICRARDELEIRVRERTAELEKVNRDLSDFNHIASHDLQEPLRQLVTFGDRLVSRCGGILSGEDRYYVDRIQALARRAKNLTSDILEYSMISSRTRHFCWTDLNMLVHNVIGAFGDEINRKNAVLEVEELRSLEVDPARLADVFGHLISNALKFTRDERPKIRIYGESTSDQVYTVYVVDNGMGFDEAYLDKIFVPFQRLHGRSKYEGSGIGLAICRKILEIHGGSITAKSLLNVGSTFLISLPIRRQKDDS